MKKFSPVLLAAAVGLGLASPAAAHHSLAMFDVNTEATATGVVKQFQYTNPHSWLVVTGPGAAGPAVDYSFEMATISYLQRQSILKNTFPPGMKVTVHYNPLKDGRSGGLLLSVVMPDGSVIQHSIAAR